MAQSIMQPEVPTPQAPIPSVPTPEPSVQPAPPPQPSVQPHMPEPNKTPITGSYQTNAQKKAETDKAAQNVLVIKN